MKNRNKALCVCMYEMIGYGMEELPNKRATQAVHRNRMMYKCIYNTKISNCVVEQSQCLFKVSLLVYTHRTHSRNIFVWY